MSSSRSIRETHDNHLRDPEFAMEYIQDALEEGNFDEVLLAIRNILNAQTEKPDCLDDPSVWKGVSRGTMTHSYTIPESAEDIIKAIQWMMSVYDDVYCDYGKEYECGYCNLEGTVRE